MPRESFSYWTRQYKRDYCKCVRLYECSVFFFYSRIHPPLRFTSVRCASLTCCVRKEHTKPNWLSKRENSEEEEKSLFFLHFLYIQYFFRWFHSLLRGSFVSFTSLVLYFSFFLINSVSVWFAMVHCIARLGYVIRYIWSNKKNGFLVVDPVQNDRKFMPFVVFRFQNISLHFVVLVSLPLANK